MKKYLTSLLLIITTVFAYGQRNKNIIKIGQNTYRVSIDMSTFRFQKASQGTSTRGGNNLSTAAACLQMILDYNELNVTQQQISTYFPTDATISDALFSVNVMDTSLWGKSIHLSCDNLNVDEDAIFDDLSTNKPIILVRNSGSGQTASLITDMSYNIKLDAQGNQTGITPINIVVRDPSTNGASTKIINWSDFSVNGNMLYVIRITGDR